MCVCVCVCVGGGGCVCGCLSKSRPICLYLSGYSWQVKLLPRFLSPGFPFRFISAMSLSERGRGEAVRVWDTHGGGHSSHAAHGRSIVPPSHYMPSKAHSGEHNKDSCMHLSDV